MGLRQTGLHVAGKGSKHGKAPSAKAQQFKHEMPSAKRQNMVRLNLNIGLPALPRVKRRTSGPSVRHGSSWLSKPQGPGLEVQNTRVVNIKTSLRGLAQG